MAVNTKPKYQVMGRGLPTYYHVVRTHDLAIAGYHDRELGHIAPRTWPTASDAQGYLDYMAEEPELHEDDSPLVWIEETRQ